MINATIEYHPENGSAPHVVRVHGYDGQGHEISIWLAYTSREMAELKLPSLEARYRNAFEVA